MQSQHDLNALVDRWMESGEAPARIYELIISKAFGDREAFNFLCVLSDRFHMQKDILTAIHFLASAKPFAEKLGYEEHLQLARKYLGLERHGEAMDILVREALSDKRLNPKEQSLLLKCYEKTQSELRSSFQHGHEVLLAYLKTHLDVIKKNDASRSAVMLEIGSTRENIPGQGSTRILAEYCQAEGIHFITVDMDPDNTQSAVRLFHEMGVDFEAINRKGEDYLREYQGVLDFVFLDAYDYDHGKHSELRQSRYRKYLGSAIDDGQCHQMHLDCAESLSKKLSPSGLICVDDTWLTNGRWSAKGTLAMPYLLDNGFFLLDIRNRAALLGRKRGGN